MTRTQDDYELVEDRSVKITVILCIMCSNRNLYEGHCKHGKKGTVIN